MSYGASGHVGHGAYSVEDIEGCRIIRGSVPMSEFGALLKSAEPGAVMDLRLAGQIGALAVIGTTAALERLRASGLPLSEQRQHQVDATRAAGLGQPAIEWVRTGDRGASSETIFSHVTGVRLLAPKAYTTPRDPSDFARCRRLLEVAPEIEAGFERMREVNPEWSALVDAWPELCATMDQEAPAWRDGAGDASATFAALRNILKAPSHGPRL